jgi:thioredoxin reductase (NADPH)
VALTSAQRQKLSGSDAGMLVVGLCAAWCGTCREFEETFSALTERYPERTFVWLDIEDDSDIAGDIDIDNFPSLAVFRDQRPVFFGVTLPQLGVVDRLIKALDAAPETPVPEEVGALYPTLLAAGSANE